MGYRVIQQPATPGSVSVNEAQVAARSRKFAPASVLTFAKKKASPKKKATAKKY